MITEIHNILTSLMSVQNKIDKINKIFVIIRDTVKCCGWINSHPSEH